MRVKIWLAAVVAILGMVQTASAQMVYSLSETGYDNTTASSLGSGPSFVGNSGDSITVSLYLNEAVNGGYSMLNVQGIATYALGINGAGDGTSSITNSANSTYQPAQPTLP